jgi:transcription elongation factor Elf1
MNATIINKIDRTSLDFFGVKSEEALKNKVNSTWNIARCPHCGKSYDMLKAKHVDDDFVCPHCGKSS